MGGSYDNAPRATNVDPPIQWTEELPHKYCGKIDRGRRGKPNKAQKCDACMAVKAAGAKAAQRDSAHRRREKMGWRRGEMDVLAPGASGPVLGVEDGVDSGFGFGGGGVEGGGWYGEGEREWMNLEDGEGKEVEVETGREPEVRAVAGGSGQSDGEAGKEAGVRLLGGGEGRKKGGRPESEWKIVRGRGRRKHHKI